LDTTDGLDTKDISESVISPSEVIDSPQASRIEAVDEALDLQLDELEQKGRLLTLRRNQLRHELLSMIPAGERTPVQLAEMDELRQSFRQNSMPEPGNYVSVHEITEVRSPEKSALSTPFNKDHLETFADHSDRVAAEISAEVNRQKFDEMVFFETVEEAERITSILATNICEKEDVRLVNTEMLRNSAAYCLRNRRPFFFFAVENDAGTKSFIKVLLDNERYGKFLSERYHSQKIAEVLNQTPDALQAAPLSGFGRLERFPYIMTEFVEGETWGGIDSTGPEIGAAEAVTMFNTIEAVGDHEELKNAVEQDQESASDLAAIQARIDRAWGEWIGDELRQALLLQDEAENPGAGEVTVAVLGELFSQFAEMNGTEYRDHMADNRKLSLVDLHHGNAIRTPDGSSKTFDFDANAVTHIGYAHARAITSGWNAPEFIDQYRQSLETKYGDDPAFWDYFRIRTLLFLSVMDQVFRNASPQNNALQSRAAIEIPRQIRQWASWKPAAIR